ncbi:MULTISPECIES: hypothetical protein [Gracilibacillus]|uniref:IDEAL domain-containing protein n=1 Tax=Gracilibacillus dipsosauri TaxID=178340 RepID=A0A317KTB0_9BACI|nr:hypothetical protein [Gracilibacillus dipsosauri]PWU66782.1 hypothetical protein DLJ74_18080 [Gracilibacillus dipsosauri]
MKKQKVSYRLKSFQQNGDKKLIAKREIPFEIKLASQLVLDDLCFSWNKARLEEKLNEAIDQQDIESFKRLSDSYKSYIWEA